MVIGRSTIVGKPTALLLLQRHATVTMCHSRTADLAGHIRNADVVVAAVGQARLVRREMVKPGAVVIDVGVSRVDGALVGDVDFEGCARSPGRSRRCPAARADDPRDAVGKHAGRGDVAARGPRVTYAEARAWLGDLIHPDRPRRPYTDVKLRAHARSARADRRSAGPTARGARRRDEGEGVDGDMVAEILRAAGFRVGLAVKPHLVDYRERIQVDGQMIPEDDLVSLVDAGAAGGGGRQAPDRGARDVRRDHRGDGVSVLRRAPAVDLAVVEVGIGGRLDSTNTVDPSCP